ncbi:tetratricopeptide repeat protein [uncultured Helicobacter sp.]|uniref:tetratricopeptide repeat protein n=1 Tax=uncultured Helicobacter sp. TaxID=175537 RepID=UPI00374E26BF
MIQRYTREKMKKLRYTVFSLALFCVSCLFAQNLPQEAQEFIRLNEMCFYENNPKDSESCTQRMDNLIKKISDLEYQCYDGNKEICERIDSIHNANQNVMNGCLNGSDTYSFCESMRKEINNQITNEYISVEKSTIESNKKAQQLLKLCDDDDSKACESLMSEYRTRFYTPLGKLLQCDRGDMESCVALGMFFYLGKTKGPFLKDKPNYFKAKKFFTKACEDANAQGCFMLGTLYLHGYGARQDSVIAKEFYGRACDFGEQTGCENYKKLKNQGY